jgi:hypothetical protein
VYKEESMMRRNYYTTPGEIGRAFENRARNALEKADYVLVKKNQWNRNYAFEKDKAKKREYDLVMFNMRDSQFYIIECKAHYAPDTLVGIKQVMEFHNKLKNYNGMSAKRMMITDTDFTIKAKSYAYQNHVALVNKQELRIIESKGGLLGSIGRKIISAGLESLVKKLFNNHL